MKGSLEGALPMLGLLIISLVLATQSLPLATALASIMEESATDLSGSATVRSQGDYLAQEHLPDAAAHSLNNAAYDIGRENAGISWSRPLDDKPIIYESIQDAWEEEANEKFSSYVAESSDCRILNNFDLTVYPDTESEELFSESLTHANATIATDNSDDILSVNCGESRELIYRKKEYSKNISIQNRYAELGNFTAEFYSQIDDALESASIQDSYTGSGSACGSSSSARSKARSSAQNSYESDTPSAPSIANSISRASEIVFDVSQSDNARVTSTDPEEGGCCDTECTSRNDEGECTSRRCTDYTQTDTVTIEPTDSDIALTVEDENTLPINGAYRKLAIIVDEYSFSH